MKFVQDKHRVVINSPKIIDIRRSKVKVTGTVLGFLKVQLDQKN